MHADHITGTGALKKMIPGSKSAIAKHSGAKADLYIEHGDKVKFGSHELEVRSTPGHTDGKMIGHTHQRHFPILLLQSKVA